MALDFNVAGATGQNLGLPADQIDWDTLSDAIGAAFDFNAGLYRFIDPRLAVTDATTFSIPDLSGNGGKARATLARKPAITTAINGRPTMDFSALANSSDLKLLLSQQQPNFSYMMPVIRPANGTTGILLANDLFGTEYGQASRVLSSGSLFFNNTGVSGATLNTLGASAMPAVGTPFLLDLTYDDDRMTGASSTPTSQWAVNGATLSPFVHQARITRRPSLRYIVGGPGGAATSLGWGGQIGPILMASRDMSQGADNIATWNACRAAFLAALGG